MGYLDYAGLQYLWGKLKEKFAPKSHSHDDRYYTEAEIDGKLSSKANSNHTHTKAQVGLGNVDNTADSAKSVKAATKLQTYKQGSTTETYGDSYPLYAQWYGNDVVLKCDNYKVKVNYAENTGTADSANSVAWANVKNKPTAFPVEAHTHDNRYYTEAEVDGMLNSKVNNNEAGADSLLSKLTTSWTATPTDNTYFIRQDTGGGDSFGRVKFSTLWNYIKGKTDGVYQPKGSYAASSHSHTKDQVGLGNVDNTADSVKSVAVANFAKETYINRYKTVNLTDLDQNTWYPVTGTGVSYNGLRHFKCNVQLNSGSKPSWSTHSAGFTAVVDILEESSGWGTTRMLGEVLINDQFFIADESKPPVGYGQMGYGSVPVWWLRGGGTYFLAADYDCTWTIQKSKYENSGQSVAPRTTYPGVNVNRSTITANLNGNATTADVANSVDWSKVQNKPSSYAPASHTHDDRYYTKTEVNTKLDGKSNIGHTHDNRYYTESEVNIKLANYQPKGNYAAASHTHNYAGSGTAGGSANSAVKLDSSAGSATQPVYFKDGKPVATTYTLNKTVPADAKFTDTDTWRGIQNNLTSDSTDQSLSAAQGKILKTLVDGKAPISHTHTKSQITDFPTSMPASDVHPWAKAATKPSYTKAEVGLGKVDNTADKDKNVNYATSAGNGVETSGSNYIRFKCGVQICWKANVAIDAYGSTYTFQAAFSAIPAITAIGCQDLDDVFFIRNITKTNFICDKKGYLNGNVSWIAVGVWK